MAKEKEKKDEEKKEEFMIIIPKEVDEGIKALPKEVQEEFEEALKKLQDDPMSVGERLFECDIKLLCAECESRNMMWLVGEDTKEVSFACEDCGLHAWMEWEEYQKAIKEFPELIYDYGKDSRG